MYCNGWEVAVDKNVVQLRTADSTPNEDDDLVEGKGVEQVIELSVLLGFAELDIVLVEPMKGQLGLVVHEQLGRILHEFSADRADLLRESSAEHHDLLLGWCSSEYLLHVAAHI